MANETKKIKNPELEAFHEHLAMLLDTGLPLPEGIRRFAGEARDSKFRDSLERIADGLKDGQSLAEAMEGEERFFPADYLSIIRVGEKGGALLDSLQLAR